MVTNVILALLGAVAGYVIIGLAAALGKLIGGLILRFQFDSFVFFMLELRKNGTGMSFGMCEPKPYIRCSMVDGRDTKMRNLIHGMFSLAMALFFTETVWIQMMGTKLLPKTAFTFPMAVVMAAYTLVLFVMLLMNQGMKVGNNATNVMRREYEKSYLAIKAGKQPGEVEIEKVEYSDKLMDLQVYKKYLLMNYYHYLDLGEYDKVRLVMDEFENYVPDRWPQAELGILCEFVFYNVIINPNEGKARFYGKQFVPRLDGNEEANSKRVFAYWLLFIEKDKGAALQIAMEAIKAVDSYHLAGCRDMERRFIEALLKRIEAM